MLESVSNKVVVVVVAVLGIDCHSSVAHIPGRVRDGRRRRLYASPGERGAQDVSKGIGLAISEWIHRRQSADSVTIDRLFRSPILLPRTADRRQRPLDFGRPAKSNVTARPGCVESLLTWQVARAMAILCG